MQDRDARCVCWLSDLTNAPLNRPKVAYAEVGTVNAYKLYLVNDSARSDTNHSRRFTIPVPVDGGGGSAPATVDEVPSPAMRMIVRVDI